MRLTSVLVAVLLLAAGCAPRAAETAAPSGTATPAPAPAPSSEPIPPQEPEKWSAAIKPVLAGVSELELPEDWDNAKRLAPASKVFKNVKLLGDDRADTFVAAMHAMKPSMGLGCKACHEKGDWASDAKDPKKAARAMIEMASAVNSRFFDGDTAVSCFTCHRGDEHPETDLPASAVAAKPKTAVRALTAAEAEQPAEKVYKNIKTLTGMPTKHVLGTMESLSRALGVSCEHCHVENGEWAKDDKKPKLAARAMMAMTGELQKTYFDGEDAVTCWTCHRGAKEPKLRGEASSTMAPPPAPGAAPSNG